MARTIVGPGAPWPVQIGSVRVQRRIRLERLTELWFAEQVRPGLPPVAVRRLLPALAGDETLRRALREVSIRARKVHGQNIVARLRAEDTLEETIQVSEYVHDITLQDLLAALRSFGARLSIKTSVWIAREILEAVDRAEWAGLELGAVDVRSVYVTRQGDLRVDFGLPLPAELTLRELRDAQAAIALLAELVGGGFEVTHVTHEPPTERVRVPPSLDALLVAHLEPRPRLREREARALCTALEHIFYSELDGEDSTDGRDALAYWVRRLLPEGTAPDLIPGPGEAQPGPTPPLRTPSADTAEEAPIALGTSAIIAEQPLPARAVEPRPPPARARTPVLPPDADVRPPSRARGPAPASAPPRVRTPVLPVEAPARDEAPTPEEVLVAPPRPLTPLPPSGPATPEALPDFSESNVATEIEAPRDLLQPALPPPPLPVVVVRPVAVSREVAARAPPPSSLRWALHPISERPIADAPRSYGSPPPSSGPAASGALPAWLMVALVLLAGALAFAAVALHVSRRPEAAADASIVVP